MGGYIYGLYHGKTVDQCVEYGQRCAVASMLSERHVGEQVSEAWINMNKLKQKGSTECAHEKDQNSLEIDNESCG